MASTGESKGKKPRKSPSGTAARPPESSATRVAPPAEAGDVERRNRERIQRTLITTVVALPLLDKLNDDAAAVGGARSQDYDVIVDAHLDFPAGRKAAREWIIAALARLLVSADPTEDPRFKPMKNKDQPQYVFVRASADVIRELVLCDAMSNADLTNRGLPAKEVPTSWDAAKPAPRAIYQIWEDFQVFPLIYGSISTVKADAGARGIQGGGRRAWSGRWWTPGVDRPQALH